MNCDTQENVTEPGLCHEREEGFAYSDKSSPKRLDRAGCTRPVRTGLNSDPGRFSCAENHILACLPEADRKMISGKGKGWGTEKQGNGTCHKQIRQRNDEACDREKHAVKIHMITIQLVLILRMSAW